MMANLPAVSIYIVTYLESTERGAVLKRTCESALAQRYPNFEVVVSDNAGTIQASDMLSSLDDARLKVIRNEKNLG
ncbi:MAG TPA: glycosyltransferase, partial [Pontiella sp.]